MVDGRRVLTALLVGLALGVMGFGLAIAQDASEEGGEVPVRRRANVLPQERLDEASTIVQRGDSISRRLLAQLDEARREHDIIRVTCLNDKLTQVNAHRRSAGDRFERLNEADQIGDRERAQHEYTVLTVLGQQFRVLESEANGCIGQDIYETGTTRIVTDIDPGTPYLFPIHISTFMSPMLGHGSDYFVPDDAGGGEAGESAGGWASESLAALHGVIPVGKRRKQTGPAPAHAPGQGRRVVGLGNNCGDCHTSPNNDDWSLLSYVPYVPPPSSIVR